MFKIPKIPALKILKLTSAFLVASASIIALTIISFKSIGSNIVDKLNKESGSVAGIQNSIENNNDIQNPQLKDIPMIPETNIISTDVQNKKTSLIAESNHNDKEIIAFYNNFLTSNGWTRSSDNEFTRKKQKFTLNVNNGIIQITVE